MSSPATIDDFERMKDYSLSLFYNWIIWKQFVWATQKIFLLISKWNSKKNCLRLNRFQNWKRNGFANSNVGNVFWTHLGQGLFPTCLPMTLAKNDVKSVFWNVDKIVKPKRTCKQSDLIFRFWWVLSSTVKFVSRRTSSSRRWPSPTFSLEPCRCPFTPSTSW